jgi:hypothetical protein
MSRFEEKMLMKKLAAAIVVLSSAALVSSASASVLIYEPFDYAGGSAISGLTNPSTGGVWAAAGTAGSPVHQVTDLGGAGSLTGSSGFPAGVGNAAALMQSDNTEFDRLALDQQYGPSSTLYYSVLINVPSLDGLTTPNTNAAANNGAFIGFNNTVGTSGTRPSVWGGALTIRLNADTPANATGYQLGVRSGAHETGTGNPTYWTQDLTPGQTYLAVVRYTSGASAGTGGLSELWIDPSAVSYGAAEGSVPSADGSATGHLVNGANDHVDSLLVGAGISTGFDPNVINIDEIRVGTTWADVTAVPEPASLGLLGLGAVGLMARRRKAC